jgi:hypothetical protein
MPFARKGLPAFALVLSFFAANAFAVVVCTSSKPANDTIVMTAIAGESAYNLTNPLLGQSATEIEAVWLTDQQLMDPTATAPVASVKPFPFTLGYCAPDANDPTKPLTQYFISKDLSALATAEAVVIRFVPNEPGEVTRFLRLKWKSGTTANTKTYKIVATGGVPDYASDSRYKLWAYTGYTFLRSKDDFQDGYAELVARTEIRWIDARVALKHYHPELYAEAVRTGQRCDRKKKDAPADARCPGATFSIMRIYGEMGLTGTTVEAVGGGTGDETELGKVAQAFGGSIGVGLGKTKLVSILQPTDTSAFSILGVARLGMISIPAAKDANGNVVAGSESRGAFNYSANIRIENEPSFRDDRLRGGNFEGAYFELGFGESEQFSRKKFPRLRFDGLIPINGGSNLFRFAGRLQIDAPRPFATKKKDPTDNLANEIRISILFNMDLLELGKRIAGD